MGMWSMERCVKDLGEDIKREYAWCVHACVCEEGVRV